MSIKLEEHTCGTHVYMKMRLDNKRIEEIDVYLHGDGNHTYITSADYCKNNHQEGLRYEIIAAFHELF